MCAGCAICLGWVAVGLISCRAYERGSWAGRGVEPRPAAFLTFWVGNDRAARQWYDMHGRAPSATHYYLISTKVVPASAPGEDEVCSPKPPDTAFRDGPFDDLAADAEGVALYALDAQPGAVLAFPLGRGLGPVWWLPPGAPANLLTAAGSGHVYAVVGSDADPARTGRSRQSEAYELTTEEGLRAAGTLEGSPQDVMALRTSGRDTVSLLRNPIRVLPVSRGAHPGAEPGESSVSGADGSAPVRPDPPIRGSLLAAAFATDDSAILAVELGAGAKRQVRAIQWWWKRQSQEVLSLRSDLVDPAISPDGTRIAFMAAGTQWSLYPPSVVALDWGTNAPPGSSTADQ